MISYLNNTKETARKIDLEELKELSVVGGMIMVEMFPYIQ